LALKQSDFMVQIRTSGSGESTFMTVFLRVKWNFRVLNSD